jgi:hypothetical protein
MIYVFYWNDCVWESAAYAVSFHYTAAGAYKAMRKYLLSEYAEWYDNPYRSHHKFGTHQAWFIEKRQIQP